MSIGRREWLVWSALATTLLWCHVLRLGGGRLMNDSYQYLSVAASIHAGHGLSTSIINFDTERMSGRVPAPLTTFPPGYPLAIAALQRLGLDDEQAGVACSMLAFVALIPLLAWCARVLELSANVTRLVFVWLLANSWTADYPLQILTESTFTALSTAAVVALMAAERREAAGARSVGLLVAGGMLVGLSYWVRYAGLFLFVAVFTHVALHALVRRSFKPFLVCAIPAGLIAPVLIRNILLTSSWQGGNTKQVVHPILETLNTFVFSSYHLLVGGKVVSRLGVVEIVLVAAGLTIAILSLPWLRPSRARGTPTVGDRAARALVTYLLVYSLSMIYAGMVSVISFGTRMFYPLLPLLLLAVGHHVARLGRAFGPPSARRFALVGATALATVCYVTLNARNLWANPVPMPHELTASRLAAPLVDGPPLRAWIDATIPADAIVLATDAQATAYVLKRKTVALTESEYSDQRWDESAVAALMATYQAEFLLLYPTARATTVAAQRESLFLSGLLEGRLPAWLSLAAENREVKVFRRTVPLAGMMADGLSPAGAGGDRR
jgi:hypothetical protein